MKHFNILICGLGGTGVIGIGALLKDAAQPEGYGVVGSETRGSAQRGGVVTSSARYTIRARGEASDERTELWSGSVPVGGADLMISTEAGEALRNVHYLSKNSRVIVNTFKMLPKVRKKQRDSKEAVYPSIEEIVSKLKQITPDVQVVDASEMSMKHYGSYAMANPILIGAVLGLGWLPLKKETILGLLRGQAKEAFELGYRRFKETE